MKDALAPAFLALAFATLGTAQTQTAKPLSVAPEQVQRVEILYFPEQVLIELRSVLKDWNSSTGTNSKLEMFVNRQNGKGSCHCYAKQRSRHRGMAMTIAPPCFYSTKTDGALHWCTSTSSAKVAQ